MLTILGFQFLVFHSIISIKILSSVNNPTIIMPKVVECVPNFSEGRDQKVLHFHVLTKYILKNPDVKKNYAFPVKCLITKKKKQLPPHFLMKKM